VTSQSGLHRQRRGGDAPLSPSGSSSRASAAQLVTLDLTDSWERRRRNLRRVLVCAAADHLTQAASMLRQAPSSEAFMLAANKTAEVLAVLTIDAEQLGLRPLPPAAVAAIPELRRWALTVREPAVPATPFDPADQRNP